MLISGKVLFFLTPPGLFPFLLQTKHFRNSTLGWLLRGAWMALGWPKGDPGVTQSQTQFQSVEGLQPGRPKYQVLNTNFRLLWLIASCQLLSAKFSMIRLTSTPEGCRILADFSKRINYELGQCP